MNKKFILLKKLKKKYRKNNKIYLLVIIRKSLIIFHNIGLLTIILGLFKTKKLLTNKLIVGIDIDLLRKKQFAGAF